MSRRLFSIDSNYLTTLYNDTSSSDNTTSDITQTTSSGTTVPGIVTITQESNFDKLDIASASINTLTLQNLYAASNILTINHNPETSAFDVDNIDLYTRQQIGIALPYRQSNTDFTGFFGLINNGDDVVNLYTEFIFLKKSNVGTIDDIMGSQKFFSSLNNIVLSEYLADIHCSMVKGNSILLRYYDRDPALPSSTIIKTYFRTPTLLDLDDINFDHNIIIGIQDRLIDNFTIDIRNSDTNIGGDLIIQKTLNVVGESMLNNLSLSSDLNMFGNIDIQGTANIESTLDVTENATFKKDVYVDGDVRIKGRLMFVESISITTSTYTEFDVVNDGISYYSIDVSGNVLSKGDFTTTSDIYGRNLTLTNDLYVTGQSNMIDVSCNVLTVGSDLYIEGKSNMLDVSCNVLTVESDLYIEGKSNMLDVSCNVLTIESDLYVTGQSNMIDVSCNVLTVDTDIYTVNSHITKLIFNNDSSEQTTAFTDLKNTELTSATSDIITLQSDMTTAQSNISQNTSSLSLKQNIFNESNKLNPGFINSGAGTLTSTKMEHLSSITSDLQTQLDSKISSVPNEFDDIIVDRIIENIGSTTVSFASDILTVNTAEGNPTILYFDGLTSSTNFQLNMTNLPGGTFKTYTYTLWINCNTYQAYCNAITVNGTSKTLTFPSGIVDISDADSSSLIMQQITVLYLSNALICDKIISNVTVYKAET